MKKIIEFLFSMRRQTAKAKSKSHNAEYPEIVWTGERVVEQMIALCESGSSNNYQFTIPDRELLEQDSESKTSDWYRYMMLKAALRAYRPEVDWDKVTDKDFLYNLIDPEFSEDKKAMVTELLGDISSTQAYLMEHEDVFDLFNRKYMIAMLIEYVCTIDELIRVWSRYNEMSIGGLFIRKFIINETNPGYKHQMKAMKLIALLLGDSYDQKLTEKELIEKYNYPNISPKEFGKLVSEEMM